MWVKIVTRTCSHRYIRWGNHNLRCEIGEQELDNIWQGKAVAQAQIYEDIKNLGREM